MVVMDHGIMILDWLMVPIALGLEKVSSKHGRRLVDKGSPKAGFYTALCVRQNKALLAS